MASDETGKGAPYDSAVAAADRPRVLHVCTRYQRGGSERRIRDMVAALPELQHDLVVGADSDAGLAKAQAGAAIVTVLPTLTRRLQPFSDIAATGALRRRIVSGRYDCVVTHQSKAGVLVRVAAPRRVPVVQSLSMASFGPGYRLAERLAFQAVEMLLARRSAAVCVVGAELALRAASAGVPRDRIHVVRSAAPLPTYVPDQSAVRSRLAEDHAIEPDRCLVAYVGSLEPRKNVASLPTFLHLLQEQHQPKPFLLVAGDGPERAAVCAALEAQGLARDAVLLGYVGDPQGVFDLLRAADLVVLLSSAEGLPQVLVQAASVGTPFVAYDVDGVSEVLGLGAQGEVVPLGDIRGAAAAAARVLASSGRGPSDPVADLSSWAPAIVRARYRDVLLPVLATARNCGRSRPAEP